MASADGKVQNLNEGGQQAFTALINSIVPDAGLGNKLTPDAVQKLSEKLSEIVGEDAAKAFREQRNERGKLLNEEGLPIIDITEPIPVVEARGFGNTHISDENPLIPLSKLQPRVRERLRQQRDRVLDLLEEEERVERLKEEQREQEEREKDLRKRKEAVNAEKEKLKAAKELQQKMGKALLRSFGKGEEEKKERLNDKLLEDNTTKQSSASKKKTVAFAELAGEDVEENDKEVPASRSTMEWGDISLGRLRTTNRPTLLSQTQQDNHLMKTTVVERIPAGSPTTKSVQDERDSDDESDGSELDHIQDDEIPADSGEESEDELEQEEVDLNFAQHQREIALEYHKKRNEIGKDAIAAMTSHSHEDDEEYVEHSLDMPISESPHPSVSRFKANRLASAYNDSTSLGASVVPESSARTIQRAIRTGKVDNDQRLVGGEADSASEEENEGMQEVLQLLKKGEVYNIGPDGNYIHAVPPRTGPREASGTSSIPSTNAVEPKSTPFPPLDRPKTSKFKVSRAQAGRPPASSPTSTASTPSTRATTPVSTDMRSSPKPGMAATPMVERSAPLLRPSPTTNGLLQTSPSSEYSFRPPGNAGSQSSAASAFSMIVDSPSFSVAPVAQKTSQPSATTPSVSHPTPRRPQHPPTVMSTVRESNATAHQAESSTNKPQKVSRFKASRI